MRPVSVTQQLQRLDLIPHMLWHQGFPVTGGRSAQRKQSQHPACLSLHLELQSAELRKGTGDGMEERPSGLLSMSMTFISTATRAHGAAMQGSLPLTLPYHIVSSSPCDKAR